MLVKIEIRNLKKQFDDNWVTDDLDLTVETGKMTVVIGKSGEGKSVLLKQIIGLIKPTSGSIIIDGVNITELTPKELPAIFAKFGYVFQSAALLDSLNVFENIGITQLEAGIEKQKVLTVVKEVLALVHLEEAVLYKYPSQLSGGMKKRVGLARTLITKPEVILYDEPTTGLDPITSRVIHELMHSMQKTFNLTSVVISHDLEILKYADHVALLHDGKIQYAGLASTAFETDNPYMYQFVRGLSDGPIQADPVEPIKQKKYPKKQI
ncbi:ATP-binding cassette domain-containing protein [bacterium]|nr:MAG: ATP-binding cassette domain-containing protein [bacterium]QQR61481.1 MAG: ATP-binding cassette domain-containing protein [bacterium]QQR62992.1 MAG: ATP-binding cassette domain-containing protein [bacterium]